MTVQTNNAAYICGSEGYVEVPWPWKPPEDGPNTFVIAVQVPPRQDAGKGGRRPREEFQVEADRPLYALEADIFAAAVLDGAPLPVSRADAIGNMRVLDELRRQVGG
jgi:predicted dehydrogenase